MGIFPRQMDLELVKDGKGERHFLGTDTQLLRQNRHKLANHLNPNVSLEATQDGAG